MCSHKYIYTVKTPLILGPTNKFKYLWQTRIIKEELLVFYLFVASQCDPIIALLDNALITTFLHSHGCH